MVKILEKKLLYSSLFLFGLDPCSCSVKQQGLLMIFHLMSLLYTQKYKQDHATEKSFTFKLN